MLPAIPLALLIHAFPESPRWLAMKGRHDDALKTLARLHAHGNTEDIFVQAGMYMLQNYINMLIYATQRWLTSRRALRKRIWRARARTSIAKVVIVLFLTFGYKLELAISRTQQPQTPDAGCHSTIQRSNDWCFCHSILRSGGKLLPNILSAWLLSCSFRSFKR
jgi:hypothetical protein